MKGQRLRRRRRRRSRGTPTVIGPPEGIIISVDNSRESGSASRSAGAPERQGTSGGSGGWNGGLCQEGFEF
ncbi:hypothetical protein PV325_003779 [Microctonus aethiopoides]|nr:hypothetical protein PV325_003779 [Microctonus aethiopoides]